jgi:hypothetical protein
MPPFMSAGFVRFPYSTQSRRPWYDFGRTMDSPVSDKSQCFEDAIEAQGVVRTSNLACCPVALLKSPVYLRNWHCSHRLIMQIVRLISGHVCAVDPPNKHSPEHVISGL